LSILKCGDDFVGVKGLAKLHTTMKMGTNNTDGHRKYKDKNGVPLPEIDEWELVGHQLGTPYQRNGL
jgi:hypothetical protein